MKRSNKILLGTLIFIVSVILLHYVSLYAMYKMNWYTKKIAKEHPRIKIVYPGNFKVVHVKGFGNAVLLMADSFYYEMDSLSYEFFKEEKRGDTLLLRGDTFHVDTTRRGIDTLNDRYGKELRIYVTGREYIMLDKCDAAIVSSKITGNMSLHLYLTGLNLIPPIQRAQAEITNQPIPDSVYRFNILALDADKHSEISLRKNIILKHLEISLGDYCSIENAEDGILQCAEVLQGSIEYSDNSRISLSGDQLRNLQLTYKKKESSKREIATPGDSVIHNSSVN